MRKGLSQVLGAILLMAITVGAVASAYTFLSSTQSQIQKNAEDKIQEQKQEASSSVDIQYGYERSDGDTAVVVRNTGSVPISFQNSQKDKIVSIYVDGPPANWEFAGSVNEPFVLPQSETVRLDTNKDFPNSGNSQVIRFSGPKGTEDTFTCYSSGTGSC